jgi:hypothetical protein
LRLSPLDISETSGSEKQVLPDGVRITVLKITIAVGALMVSLTRCAKIESGAPSNDQVSAKTTTWGICCVWDEECGECTPVVVNCYEPIIITSDPELTAQANLDNAADGDAEDVSTFFSGLQWATLFPDLDADEGEHAYNAVNLDSLRTGRYDMLRCVDGDNSYYMAGPEGELAIDNVDFVLVLEDGSH